MWLVLRRWRWPAVVVAMAVAALTLVVVNAQVGGYESSGTFVVRPVASDERSVIRATANLTDGQKISRTLAYIAEGDLIENRALDTVGSVEAGVGYDIQAAVAPGTNVVTISVRSDDPETAFAMALAVSNATIDYVDALGGAYALSTVDPPTEAARLLRPWADPVWLTAAATLGLLAGLAIAVVADRLLPRGLRPSRGAGRPVCSNRVDEERYTRLRLRNEVARTDDTGVPFQFGLIQVGILADPQDPAQGTTPPTQQDVRGVVAAVQPLLREFDHLGHIPQTDQGTFVALLPAATDDDALAFGTACSDATIERIGPTGNVAVFFSSCRYQNEAFRGDADATLLAESL